MQLFVSPDLLTNLLNTFGKAESINLELYGGHIYLFILNSRDFTAQAKERL